GEYRQRSVCRPSATQSVVGAWDRKHDRPLCKKEKQARITDQVKRRSLDGVAPALPGEGVRGPAVPAVVNVVVTSLHANCFSSAGCMRSGLSQTSSFNSQL